MTPMKMNSGSAISTSFVITPKMRYGNTPRKSASNTSIAMPISPKISAVPASVKEIGKPSRTRTISARNMARSSYSLILIP